jgi:rubrerythrin
MRRFVNCSHKRAYRTKREATEVAEHQMQRNRGLVLRVYTCPICGDYHLTSKPPRY